MDTLFYPGRGSISAPLIRNQIAALAGDAPTVSLSGFRGRNPSANNGWSEIRVSSGSKHSIAHMYKVGNREVFSTFGVFLSSHRRDRQVGIQKGFFMVNSPIASCLS